MREPTTGKAGKVPTDSVEVMPFDLSEIGEDQFTWPTAPTLQHTLRLAVLNIILKNRLDLPDDAAKALNSTKGISIDVAQILYSRHVSKTSLRSVWVDDTGGKSPNSDIAWEQFRRLSNLSVPGSAFERAKWFVVGRCQEVMLKIVDFLRLPRPLLYTSHSSLHERVARKWKYRIRSLPGHFSRTKSVSPKQETEIEDAVERLSKQIREKCATLNVSVDDAEVTTIKELMRRAARMAMADYNHLRAVFGNRRFDIMARSMSAYRTSILGTIARENGGEVIGAEHGSIDFDIINEIHLGEFVTATKFLTRGKDAKGNLSKAYLDHFDRPLETEVIHCPGPAALLQKNTKSSSEIRKIMFIGGGIRLGSSNGPLPIPVLLDMEVKIVRGLAKAGVEVIYKAYPANSWNEHHHYFGDMADINVEPFENVWNEADAFAILCSQTSAFDTAKDTGLPIIYFWDPKMDAWTDTAIERIGQRCNIVPVSHTRNNTLTFDEKKLELAIAGLQR
jgi:hypothetical protein